MKLVLLGLFLLLGVPLAVYGILGPAALENPSVVMGTIGSVVVLFGMSCVFTIKNILNFFVDFLLVTTGALLLLLAAFAKPLGLFENPEGEEIERRIMGDPKPQDGQTGTTREQHADAPVEQHGEPSLDEILDPEQKPAVSDTPAADKSEPSQTAVQADPKQAAMPAQEKAVTEENDQPKEGLERFAEESGQD